MNTYRAVRLARLVESVGADLTVADIRTRRAGRLQRVHDAALRERSARAPTTAARELERQPARADSGADAPPLHP